MIIDLLKASSRWEEYTRHKFVRLMKEGLLPFSAFRYYIIQDAKYVEEMNRASLKAASNAPNFEEALRFINAMLGSSDKGKEIHDMIHKTLNLNENEIRLSSMDDINYSYTRHLHYWAEKDWIKFLIALTPCMLGYYEIGVFAKDSKNPVYRTWAEFYSSEIYKNKVDVILDILKKNEDRIREDIEENIDIFRRSVNYEISFWERGLIYA